MPTLGEQADAYRSSRARIAALTASLDDAGLARTVPCCPRWSVKDLVAHLAGLLEDRRDGRLPAGGFDAWTERQVERYRDQPIGSILDTWTSTTLAVDDAPPSLGALSLDVVTHEHDVCQAVGVQGDRASMSVHVGAARALERMVALLADSSAPGVSVTTESGTVLASGGAPAITLAATDYEVMRLVTGRYSRAQALGLAWGGDPSETLDVLFADGFFSLQPQDVIETATR